MNSSKGIEQPRGLALDGARCPWGCCRTSHRRTSSAGLCPVQPTPLKGWGDAHLLGSTFRYFSAQPRLRLHTSLTWAGPRPVLTPLRQRSAGLSGEGPTTGPQKAAPSLLPCLTAPPTPALSEVRGRRSAARRAHLPGASPPSGTSGSGRRDSACAASCRSCSSGSRCTCSACCFAPCA